MILSSLVLFLVSLFILLKSSDYATVFSSKLARFFRLPEFLVSFTLVAVISAFPEGTVSVMSAIKGVPEIGLGTLLGSNVADLALAFGIIAVVSSNGVPVRSAIIKKNFFFLALLLFPIILGFDGRLSRLDGVLLVLSGSFFFLTLSIEANMFTKTFNNLKPAKFRHVIYLILSLGALLLSANYTLKYAVQFANDIGVPPVLVGLTVLSVGSCLPELLFSLRALKNNHSSMVFGDILGTVITDATILVGVVALIRPFSFDPLIIYVTGIAMFIAGLLAVWFIESGKVLTRKEGFYLIGFYLIYLVTEVLLNKLV